MTTLELLTGLELLTVPKGRMSRIGWRAGYLVVEYPGGSLYVHGPNVAEAECGKFLRHPYPDNLLLQLKKKHGWQSKKVK